MIRGRKCRYLRDESGDIIVEATIVFPIMFIVLLLLMYMGNAYYIQAKIESVVVEKAIDGANRCTDPLLKTVRETGAVPYVSDVDIQPYRYLFGGMDEIEADVSDAVVESINSSSGSFFKGMRPEIKTSPSEIAHFNNYVVYSTFSVEVQYEVQFPIKFFGAKQAPIMHASARSEVPISDTAEFIRNSDMVIDLFSGTKVGQKVSEVFGKVNDFISQFASK